MTHRVILAKPYTRRPLAMDHGTCFCGRPRKGDSATCSVTCHERERLRIAAAITAAKKRRAAR